MRYNLYYTLNINIPDEPFCEKKKKEVIEKISSDTSLKSDRYLLLILEHACNGDENIREDILKGILPYGIRSEANEVLTLDAEDTRVFVDENQIPDKLFYILEKAMSL